jgi:hypothetical protein
MVAAPAAGGGISVRKRVQAPSAPGFYRSCASRRTMGSAHRAGWFRGSYECCLRQRVPGPLWRWAGDIICILGSNRGKTIRPRLWREGNAPLFPCGDFPRRGKFAFHSALGLISTSMHCTTKSSPSGGKVVPKVPKGAHFLRASARLYGFPFRGAEL